MNGKDVLYIRSTKKKSKMGSDIASVTEDDIWDDSVLVEAYNKAIDHAHAKVLKNLPNIPPKTKVIFNRAEEKKEWNVGDFCRCEYSGDHRDYEAIIIDVMGDLGMCVVKFVGYENEEKTLLSNLTPSQGEVARSEQKKQAVQEKGVIGGKPHDIQPRPANPPHQGKKKNAHKKTENAKGKESAPANDTKTQSPTSQTTKPTLMGEIPPPPPPHMFSKMEENGPESDAMNAMLMSWYMSGYHTGYYQGLKAAKK